MHLEQRDGLDRRPDKTTLDVADHRAPRFHVDGHAHDRVDHRETVGPASMQRRAFS
jgi:hypothetical protein